MRQLDEAIKQYQQALESFAEVGRLQGQAMALENLASSHHHAGHHQLAITVGLEALDLFNVLGDRYGVALCNASLSNAYRDLGRLDEAMASVRTGSLRECATAIDATGSNERVASIA